MHLKTRSERGGLWRKLRRVKHPTVAAPATQKAACCRLVLLAGLCASLLTSLRARAQWTTCDDFMLVPAGVGIPGGGFGLATNSSGSIFAVGQAQHRRRGNLDHH